MIAEEPALSCDSCGQDVAVLLCVEFPEADAFHCPPCAHRWTGQTHFRITCDEFDGTDIVGLEITITLPEGEVTRRRMPRQAR